MMSLRCITTSRVQTSHWQNSTADSTPGLQNLNRNRSSFLRTHERGVRPKAGFGCISPAAGSLGRTTQEVYGRVIVRFGGWWVSRRQPGCIRVGGC